MNLYELSEYDRWKTTPPDEPLPVDKDWNGDPLYPGDVVYETPDGDLVLEEYVVGREMIKFMDFLCGNPYEVE